MILSELLSFLNTELLKSIKQHPENEFFIKKSYHKIFTKLRKYINDSKHIDPTDIYKLDLTDYMKEKILSALPPQDLSDNSIGDKLSSPTNVNASSHIKLMTELTNIMGIGNAKALELINLGLKHVKYLYCKKWQAHISKGTKLFLKYKPVPDIQASVIKELEPIFLSFKNTTVKLVGGFLRKKPVCHDIDIMLITDNNDILTHYISFLKKNFEEIHIVNKGNSKVSGMLLYNGSYLKFDLFKTATESQFAALLTHTGSKKFNIQLRSIAKKKGFLLNQYGIYRLKNINTPLLVKSERDIFKILQITYIKPEYR